MTKENQYWIGHASKPFIYKQSELKLNLWSLADNLNRQFIASR